MSIIGNTALSTAASAANGNPDAARDDDTLAALTEELERLRARLDEMEDLERRVRMLEDQLARARLEAAHATAATTKRDAGAGMEESAEGTATADTAGDGIDFEGALRFNAFWSDSNETIKATRGDSGLDLFRVGASGSVDNILVSAEYRFYPFMDVIHHGWIGYEFENQDRVQLGITKVPFGLLPYAAHNFWFGVPYYLGLSDDYDTGVKYLRSRGPWDLQLAFFKNGEFSSATDVERYSFDVVAAGETQNEEINQFNLRAAYTFGADTTCSHELGLSGQWGELYNADTDRRGNHWALAGHVDSRCGRWNLQLEAARFEFAPENPAGIDNERIRMGGFATSYDVAAEGTVAVANVAYNVPLNTAAIDQLICYNDYSVLFKDTGDYRKSQLNTTGCALGRGPLFVYLDLIRGNNMVFFGDGSLAGDGDRGWDTRFNVNVGYYW